jgi:hypothetical protein
MITGMPHHTCGREVNSPPHVRSSLVPLTIPDTKFSTRLNVWSCGELTSRPYVQRSWCLSRVVSQHDRLLGYQEITPVPHWEGHSHTTLRRRSPPLWRLKEHGQTQHTALQKNIQRYTSDLSRGIPEESDQFRSLRVSCWSNLKGLSVWTYLSLDSKGLHSDYTSPLGSSCLLWKCLLWNDKARAK